MGDGARRCSTISLEQRKRAKREKTCIRRWSRQWKSTKKAKKGMQNERAIDEQKYNCIGKQCATLQWTMSDQLASNRPANNEQSITNQTACQLTTGFWEIGGNEREPSWDAKDRYEYYAFYKKGKTLLCAWAKREGKKDDRKRARNAKETRWTKPFLRESREY